MLIIEPQWLFGKAVAQIVGEDRAIAVAGIARTYRDLGTATGRIDVVIVDFDSDIADIEPVVEYLQAACPVARICALSMYSEPELMQRCLSAGVDGYIVKDSSLQELIAAVKSLAQGTSYVDPRVAASLLRARQNAIPANGDLSPREVDVIRLIARGLSNKDISERLVLSEKTVKNHISRILSKLHLKARTQAAVHAIRHGLA